MAAILVGALGCSVDRGGLQRVDGATRDAGSDGHAAVDGCTPGPETCNGVDDDCDGEADEGFDLTTDLANCGACSHACDPDPGHAAPLCSDGTCAMNCDAGWADCDGVAGNGCEADLSDPSTCGSCGRACVAPLPLCDGGTCVDACSARRTLCGDRCVDTRTDPLHCGMCDRACSSVAHGSPACTSGTCGLACDPGFDDCDGAVTNGCEQALNTVMHCGVCGLACPVRTNATPTCAGTTATCGFECRAGFGDCDSNAANGCEARLDTIRDCLDCGVVCPTVPNGVPTCDRAAGGCGFVCDPGFDDCTTAPGCETVLGTPTDCTACGDACPSGPGAMGMCAAGACTLACSPGFGDCDGNSTNGCEADLRDGPTSCGSCDRQCATDACAGGTCVSASGVACAVGCSSCGPGCCTASPAMVSGTWSPSCPSGCECTYDCPLASDCRPICNGSTVCAVNCDGASRCEPSCGGSGQCTFDCRGVPAGSCHPRCTGSSSCVLFCDASVCTFEACHSGEMSCGAGVTVCDRSCP